MSARTRGTCDACDAASTFQEKRGTNKHLRTDGAPKHAEPYLVELHKDLQISSCPAGMAMPRRSLHSGFSASYRKEYTGRLNPVQVLQP